MIAITATKANISPKAKAFILLPFFVSSVRLVFSLTASSFFVSRLPVSLTVVSVVLVSVAVAFVSLLPLMVIVPFLCRFTAPALGGLSASPLPSRIKSGELCA